MAEDIFRFNNINLDRWTENYTTTFYFNYLARWPELCIVAESEDGGCLAGYLIAKVEGEGLNWHSHISALSVCPEFRKAGVAKKLCEYFEEVSVRPHNCFFADLYVRKSNSLAIKIYKARGYIIYRIVKGYYGGEEDAYDMRKPLERDVERKSVEGAGFSVEPHEVE